MKLQLALSAILLAGASAIAAAHPHQVPQPPAPPAPPGVHAPAAPPAPPAHAHRFAPPALPAPPAMPAMPPAPPIPPIPDIDVPDEVLAACEGKADGTRITQTIANGAHITGTCKKRGNVYLFKLNSYEMHSADVRTHKRR